MQIMAIEQREKTGDVVPSTELADIRKRLEGRLAEFYSQETLVEDARVLFRMLDELREENEKWRYAVCGNAGWMQDVGELRTERNVLRTKLAVSKTEAAKYKAKSKQLRELLVRARRAIASADARQRSEGSR
jgi:hypothetical protein